MMNYLRIIVIACGVLFFCGLPATLPGEDFYVDCTLGDDGNSGLDWSNAKSTIQSGLDASEVSPATDTVHVAEGTYTGGIALVSGTTLLGGYPTGGGLRNPSIHESIINLDRRFVAGAPDAVIDGFTIMEGEGIYCVSDHNIVISNNVIENNSRKGVFL